MEQQLLELRKEVYALRRELLESTRAILESLLELTDILNDSWEKTEGEEDIADYICEKLPSVLNELQRMSGRVNNADTEE